MPSLRKDLIFDRRSKEDAEGERRIIGSNRRPELLVGVLGLAGMEGALGLRWEARGWLGGGAPGLEEPGFWPGRFAARERWRNVSAALRTWEKSYER
jgi:hypothetical protein